MKNIIKLNESQLRYIISEAISDALNVNKSHQLSVIKDNNPAPDDIHAWIRAEEDIKTYEEAINDNGGIEDLTPDYKSDDIKKALMTGKVIVYSSYPIKPGIFVTPSRMEAQNYAGNGRIYSKLVNLSDVAWIDPLQGQYIG
jgi:hypothetical protein